MNYKEKEELEKKYRIWKMFLYIAGTLCLIAFLYLCRLIGAAVHYYRQNRMVHSAVTQMAQLTSNIRIFYTVHVNEPIPSIQKMIEVGALPISIFKDNIIKNPFGGEIIIEQAKHLQDQAGNVISPTFKIAYQGLSKESCVRLATVDWGNKEHGLVAVAVGHTEPDGRDTALEDIDADFATQQMMEITDPETGKIQSVPSVVRYKINVAKPEDNFMPAPFSEDSANTACDCNEYRNCSFALNYTLFGYK